MIAVEVFSNFEIEVYSESKNKQENKQYHSKDDFIRTADKLNTFS